MPMPIRTPAWADAHGHAARASKTIGKTRLSVIAEAPFHPCIDSPVSAPRPVLMRLPGAHIDYRPIPTCLFSPHALADCPEALKRDVINITQFSLIAFSSARKTTTPQGCRLEALSPNYPARIRTWTRGFTRFSGMVSSLTGLALARELAS